MSSSYNTTPYGDKLHTQRRRRTFACCVQVHWKLNRFFCDLNPQEKWDDKLSCRLRRTNEQSSHTGSADRSQTLGPLLTAPSLSDFCPRPVSERHTGSWVCLTQTLSSVRSLTLRALTVWQMALFGSLSLSVVPRALTQKGARSWTERARDKHAHIQRGTKPHLVLLILPHCCRGNRK